MANIQQGEVEVTIDGVKRNVKFTLHAIASLIETLNLENIEALPEAIDNGGIEVFLNVLQAGLMHEEKDDTIESLTKSFFSLLPTKIALINALGICFWGPDKIPLEQTEVIQKNGIGEKPGALQ